MTAMVVSPISDQLKCMNPMMKAKNGSGQRGSGFYLLEMTAMVVSLISDQMKIINTMMNARNARVSIVAAFTYLK